MSMSVGASSYSAAWQQNSHRCGNRPPPPSAENLASQIFSNLDSGNKGYLSETDLENAFSSIGQTGSTGQSGTTSSSTSEADNLMKSLDTNADGKVSQDELAAALKQAFSGHDRGQFAMRMAAQGMGPSASGDPDGDGDNDQGLTRDQLTQMASTLQGTGSNTGTSAATDSTGNSVGNLTQELMALVKTFGQQSAASSGASVDSLLSVSA